MTKPIHPIGATDHPDALPDCEHEWRTSNYVIDTNPPIHFRTCQKCGAEEQTNWNSEWEPCPTRPKPVSPVPPQPAPLTATERSAFLGLQAQARQYEQAINEQERAIVAEIETRLGLDVGAIGVSHTVNAQTWQVVAMPQPGAEPAVAPDA